MATLYELQIDYSISFSYKLNHLLSSFNYPPGGLMRALASKVDKVTKLELLRKL